MGGLVRQDLAVWYLGGLRRPFALLRFPATQAFLGQLWFVGLGKGNGHHQAVDSVQDGIHSGAPSSVYGVMRQTLLALLLPVSLSNKCARLGLLCFIVLFRHVMLFSGEMGGVSVLQHYFSVKNNIQLNQFDNLVLQRERRCCQMQPLDFVFHWGYGALE